MRSDPRFFSVATMKKSILRQLAQSIEIQGSLPSVFLPGVFEYVKAQVETLDHLTAEKAVAFKKTLDNVIEYVRKNGLGVDLKGVSPQNEPALRPIFINALVRIQDKIDEIVKLKGLDVRSVAVDGLQVDALSALPYQHFESGLDFRVDYLQLSM